MRIVLIGLIIVFLLSIAGGVAFYVHESQYAGQFNASSKAYVDEAVPAIVSTWSKDELVKRSSPLLQEKLSSGNVDQLFSELGAHLGAYQSYDGSTGEASSHFSVRHLTMMALATYEAHASFQNGKLKIKFILRSKGDSWEIMGFDIHPENLSSP